MSMRSHNIIYLLWFGEIYEHDNAQANIKIDGSELLMYFDKWIIIIKFYKIHI